MLFIARTTRARSGPRRELSGLATLLFFLGTFLSASGRPATAEEARGLNGTWKLTTDPKADAGWAIVNVGTENGEPVVKLVDATLNKPACFLATSPDALVLLLAFEQGDLIFKARLGQEVATDHLAGALRFRARGFATISRAVLARTTATKLAKPDEDEKDSQLIKQDTLRALVEARKATAEWGEERYAALDRTVADAAARALGIDAPTAVRAWATSRCIDAAKRAGAPDVAAEAELARLKSLVDQENRPCTVPLVVEASATPRPEGAQRAVLMELFTGAHCGPCVAADVAFDALRTSHNPTDLITLQYHLHIPQPDPLTCADSVARQEYYEVRSTPSTFFNGRALAGSGGGLADSRRKFHQYRHVVEELAKVEKQATIDLSARRDGDVIHMTADAKVVGPPRPTASPKLRIALVEDVVPYSGRNRLAEHHYVVRAMTGGAQGRALKGGEIRADETIKLDAVRDAQEAYLKQYPGSPESRGTFSPPPPPIELKRLHVVAFLQDDEDRTVWDVVVAPVD